MKVLPEEEFNRLSLTQWTPLELTRSPREGDKDNLLQLALGTLNAHSQAVAQVSDSNFQNFAISDENHKALQLLLKMKLYEK